MTVMSNYSSECSQKLVMTVIRILEYGIEMVHIVFKWQKTIRDYRLS